MCYYEVIAVQSLVFILKFFKFRYNDFGYAVAYHVLVFNADKSGLYYNLMPDRAFKLKGENCSGDKLSKDRMIFMVAANLSGTEKNK